MAYVRSKNIPPKSKNEYYYIQHGYRENGKVVTKTIAYCGKVRPTQEQIDKILANWKKTGEVQGKPGKGLDTTKSKIQKEFICKSGHDHLSIKNRKECDKKLDTTKQSTDYKGLKYHNDFKHGKQTLKLYQGGKLPKNKKRDKWFWGLMKEGETGLDLANRMPYLPYDFEPSKVDAWTKVTAGERPTAIILYNGKPYTMTIDKKGNTIYSDQLMDHQDKEKKLDTTTPKPAKKISRTQTEIFEKDLSKYNFPWIADLQENPEYNDRRRHKALQVIYMTPDEYIETVKKGTGQDDILSYREVSPKMIADMKGGDKFSMPYVEYSYITHRESGYFGQEGLHRAMASKEIGQKQIPVAVIYPSTVYEYRKVTNLMTPKIKKKIDKTKVRTKEQRKQLYEKKYGKTWDD